MILLICCSLFASLGDSVGRGNIARDAEVREEPGPQGVERCCQHHSRSLRFSVSIQTTRACGVGRDAFTHPESFCRAAVPGSPPRSVGHQRGAVIGYLARDDGKRGGLESLSERDSQGPGRCRQRRPCHCHRASARLSLHCAGYGSRTTRGAGYSGNTPAPTSGWTLPGHPWAGGAEGSAGPTAR